MTPKKRHKYLLSTAKRRNIEVNLKASHYDDLLELGCAFCGETLTDKNGVCLDRLDNSKGYIENNVAPCCKICNRAKNDMTDQNEFFTWIEKVHKHMKQAEARLNSEEYRYITKSEQKRIRNVYMNSTKMRNSQTLLNKKK